MMFQLRSRLQILLTRRGRRLVAGQALAIAIASALLLIPTTCAQVTGPHSIFLDPTGDHAHHHVPSEDVDDGFASSADLAWHVTLGDASPSWVLSDSSDLDDACPTTPQLRELPSTMAMGSAGAAMSLEIVDSITFPLADEPVAHDGPTLSAVTAPVEAPPPR